MEPRKLHDEFQDDFHDPSDAEADHFDENGNPVFHGGDETESAWLVSYADMMTLIVGFFAILLASSKIDPAKFELVKKETTQLFGGQYQIPFKGLSDDMKKIVASSGLSDQIRFQQTEDGVAITFQGAMFFESGAVDLRAEAVTLLTRLAPIIKTKAKDLDILIEGHTDDVPISSSRFPSNWELSSMRACSVLRLFLENGFDAERLKAIGLGSTQPVVPNGDEASRSQNRRVVIRLMKSFGVRPNDPKAGNSP